MNPKLVHDTGEESVVKLVINDMKVMVISFLLVIFLVKSFNVLYKIWLYFVLFDRDEIMEDAREWYRWWVRPGRIDYFFVSFF